MSEIQALTGPPRSEHSRFLMLNGNSVRAASHVQERFYIEDGWVFREHHGKYVECICRSDDIAKLPTILRAGQG